MSRAPIRPIPFTWLAASIGLLGLGCEGEISAPRRADPGPYAGTGAFGPGPSVPGTGPAAASGNSAAARAVDDAMRAMNPTLFDAALRYFPSDTPVAGRARMFRLTRTQLDLTTRNLLPGHYKAALAETMPRDPLQTNYEYADNLGFNAANFTPYTQWVQQLVASVRAAPATVIDCTAMNNAPGCLDQQARKFVTRAFRGVVNDAQLLRFSTFFQAGVKEVGVADATADLVDLTLNSPSYVFRDEVPAGAPALSPAQRLQHISYTLADAPPEVFGLSSANAATQLASPDATGRTITQVMATPEARQKLMRFFIAWLEVREPDEFALAPDVFPEFTPELAAAVVEETRAFLNHQLSAAAPRLKDVTQSTQSFVSSALATLYGIRKPAGTGPTELDPTQRLGIFTLPGVIASHSGPTTTRLVKRGVFFTRKVMCLPLGLPPPGVNTTLPTTTGKTERQRVESATATAACQGCHAYINPFGFMQENYDPLGRYRTKDEGLPIDASIQIDFLDEGSLSTKTPIEALKSLTSSLRFQQCFARQLFRFYMGRDEAAGDDPLLRQMFFGLADQGKQNIVDMLEVLARSPHFSQRSEAP